MKTRMFLFALLCFTFLFMQKVEAQYYGITPQPACWTTSAGVDSSIFYVSISAAATTKPTTVHYFTWTGTTIQAVTVSGGTVTPGFCGSVASMDSIQSKVYTSQGYGFIPDTILANSVHSVSITNFGSSTKSVIVDGTDLRIWPGESYFFKEWYDRNRNEWHYNPLIIVPTGDASVNATRVLTEPKN